MRRLSAGRPRSMRATRQRGPAAAPARAAARPTRAARPTPTSGRRPAGCRCGRAPGPGCRQGAGRCRPPSPARCCRPGEGRLAPARRPGGCRRGRWWPGRAMPPATSVDLRRCLRSGLRWRSRSPACAGRFASGRPDGAGRVARPGSLRWPRSMNLGPRCRHPPRPATRVPDRWRWPRRAIARSTRRRRRVPR